MRFPVIELVEGESDRTALEALTIRRGLDLVAALELDRVPEPLDRILAAALRESESHPC